jgi:hypothetical protein
MCFIVEEDKRKFMERLPETEALKCNMVWQLIAKLRATGSVKDTERSSSPTVLAEDKITDISDRITHRLRKSVTDCVSKWACHLLPYKTTSVHELMFFSDDAWFHLSGYVNAQNSRVVYS